jgi:malate synthase
VVPILNARYALNAANARWGSLYDALYGTDAIPETGGADKGPGYNEVRGDKVIAYARKVLDQAAPLAKGSHVDATGLPGAGGKLVVQLKGGTSSGLKNPAQFVGYQGDAGAPSSVLLVHNGLHLDIRIDRSPHHRPHRRGGRERRGAGSGAVHHPRPGGLDRRRRCAGQAAGVRNWLGILKGTLTEQVAKGGKSFTRGLNADRVYKAPQGNGEVRLHGRSLLFLRNVGHLMTNPAILWGGGKEIPEGILDAVITTAIALHDLQGQGRERHPQLAHRLGLHRQAEDARAEGSGVRLRAVRPRRAGAGPGGQHGEAGHHGRGAPHQRQPAGLHRRSGGARRLHQHRLPRSHRRRDAHRDATPARCCARAT